MKQTTLTDKQVNRGPQQRHMQRFFNTAIERHRIYQLRTDPRVIEPPWTTDPIFQRCRFCNVYRELDKVTVWIREEWREPYADHKNLAFAMAIARLINWPPTLEEIGFPKRWNPERVAKIIRDRKADDKKVYTGAYLLGSAPTGSARGDYLVHDILTPLYSKIKTAPIYGDIELSWNWLRLQKGIGDFLAYEIASDLRHTRYLRNAPDIMTWTNMGPGALRGLTRLWGYQPKTRKEDGYIFPKARALEAAQMLLKRSKEYLPDFMPPWEMRDVEHWNCEYDKYERITRNQGVLEKFVPLPDNVWTREQRRLI